MVDATAIGDGETQRRSYPGVRGQYGTQGWELVQGLDLVANAATMAEQALALLEAPQCPEGTTTIVLDSDQVALQIHESVGHAVELDRILGWEAAFAGTSWLDPARLGDLRFGSEVMQITADATLPGAMGSFGYDDEGVPAQSVDIVRDGRWVGVLSGRDSAPAYVSRLLTWRLSRMVTDAPLRDSARARLWPMKPAPPTSTTRRPASAFMIVSPPQWRPSRHSP